MPKRANDKDRTMDEIEKMKQDRAVLDAKIASAISARKKAWQTGAEKRMAMVGEWLLTERKIPLDGGLDEMPKPFVDWLSEKQKAVWAKPWERAKPKATAKAPDAPKPPTQAPDIPSFPAASPAVKAPQVATANTRLDVPYADKDAAKAAGAKFDITNRFWFAPVGADLAPLERWLNTTDEK